MRRTKDRRKASVVKDPLTFLSMLVHRVAGSYDTTAIREAPVLLGHLRARNFSGALAVADSMALQTYNTPSEHFIANQLASLVKKNPIKDPSLNPEKAAWKKFYAAEHTCKRINQRLLAEKRVCRFAYSDMRSRARSYILRVIGAEPDLKAIYERCGFGPGASVGVHGTATHTSAKLCSDEWTVTPAALDFARSALIGDDHIREFLLGDPRYADCGRSAFRIAFMSKVRLVQANKITMVPKTAKIHRAIAIEPLLNGFVQAGCDQYLKEKLLRFGIDITDQKRNQGLAYQGSLQGWFNPFVTIDLSAASDSIAIETARDLLPPAWFDFLNALRSPCFSVDGLEKRYEKFSSMGNGFCFPLETLLFASLAYSANTVTGDTMFSVYGDDIIVRQSAAALVIEYLKFYGFKTNTEKTFLFGPFRESCGADFFEGVNVRPYSLDFIPFTSRDIMKISNGLTLAGVDDSSIHSWLRSMVPSRECFVRPLDGPPDTAFSVSEDVFLSSHFAKWNRELQTWSWKEFVTSSISDDRRAPSSVQMYGLLRGRRSKVDGTPEDTLRRKTRTRVRVVPDTSLTTSR